MKNFFNINIPKYLAWGIYIIAICCVLNTCNSCGTNKEMMRSRKQVESLTKEVDSLRNSTYSKEELDIKWEIEGYKISKRMLYDNNAIVRTTIRPDDRMNEYDQEIQKLQKKLK